MAKIQIDFSTYTLLVPFLAFMAIILNDSFGVSCGDACKVHSYFWQYVYLGFVCCLGVIDVVSFILFRRNTQDEKYYYWLTILNCMFCFYAFLFISIGGWAVILVAIPALITVSIQLVLWCRLFFKQKPSSRFWKIIFFILLLFLLFS